MGKKTVITIIFSVVLTSIILGGLLYTQLRNTESFNKKIVDASLPVIVLNTKFGMDVTTNPTYPKAINISVPMQYANKLSAYGAANKVIVGPKDWTGMGSIGVDGGSSVELYPNGGSSKQGPNLMVREISGCVGCALESAAIYFPGGKELFEKAFPGVSVKIPNGLKIQNLSASLLKFSLPNTTDGLAVNGMAYFDPSNNKSHFIEETVTLPSEESKFSNALLDVFIDSENIK